METPVSGLRYRGRDEAESDEEDVSAADGSPSQPKETRVSSISDAINQSVGSIGRILMELINAYKDMRKSILDCLSICT